MAAKKTYFYLFICAIYCGIAGASAQVITVKYSEPKPYNPFRESVMGVLQGDDAGIYMLKNRYFGGRLNRTVMPTLQKYDNNLNVVFEKEYKIDADDNARYALDEFVYMKGVFLMFASKYERADKKQIVYATRIAADGTVLTKAQSVMKYDFTERADRAAINIVTSEDTTKALVYFEVERLAKAENDKLNFGVFDAQLTQIWSKSIVLPYSARKSDIVNCTVGNNGDVFVLCKIYDIDARRELKRNDDGKRESAFKYVLLQYNATDEVPKEYEILLPEKQIVNLKYRLTNTGSIIIAGFYSDASSTVRGLLGVMGGQGITGIFYAQIDGISKKIVATSLKPFDQKFAQELKLRRGTYNARDGKLTVSPYFVPQRFILRDDGGVVIISEYVNIYTTQTMQPNGVVITTYHYEYLDIIATNVDAQGSIIWNAVVPKYQYTVNDGGYVSSYAVMVHQGQLHFIFNDNARNFEAKARGFANINARRPQKNVAAIASIDAEGNVKKSILFDYKSKNSYLQPRRSSQPNANDLIIYAESPPQRILGITISKNKYALCKLNFE